MRFASFFGSHLDCPGYAPIADILAKLIWREFIQQIFEPARTERLLMWTGDSTKLLDSRAWFTPDLIQHLVTNFALKPIVLTQ